MLLSCAFGGEAIWWAPLVSETVCLAMAAALFIRYSHQDLFWRGEDAEKKKKEE